MPSLDSQSTQPTNSLQSLQEQLNQTNLQASQERVIPPLEKWQPKFCGEMDMVVKANGEWWHEGRKVTRQSLVDLFAKVLWAEIDDNNQITYFLKTPVEKLRIQVEDAPLLITQVDTISKDNKDWIEFTTSQGDKVMLDEQHPIRFGLPFNNSNSTTQNATNQNPVTNQQPYILVRQNGESVLYALIHRNVFFHLVAMGELQDQGSATTLRLVSGGQPFTLSMPNDIG